MTPHWKKCPPWCTKWLVWKTPSIKNVTPKAAKTSWVWRSTGKSSTYFCNLAHFQTVNSEMIAVQLKCALSHLDFGLYQPWWPSRSTWFVQASCHHVFLCRPLVQPDTSDTDLQMANDWPLPVTTPPPKINSKWIIHEINKSRNFFHSYRKGSGRAEPWKLFAKIKKS